MILTVYHQPVLTPKVLELLKIKKGGTYIDATVGFGGYALEIIKNGGKVIGFDKDEKAISYLRDKHLQDLILRKNSFAEIKSVLKRLKIAEVEGAIFDLGLSSYQLDQSGRGFSFKRNEPLDMRFDQSSEFTAADVINNYSVSKLYEIFTKNAEELNSRSIAEAVVRTRALEGVIATTFDLNRIIESLFKFNPHETNRVKARIFQALRIEVNNELEEIKKGLRDTIEILGAGGRILVISYQSLEDRIVKEIFKNYRQIGKLKMDIKKPIFPEMNEVNENPRSKSAKLRIAEKL